MNNQLCHWAGIDVGKQNIEVALLLSVQGVPDATLKKIPVRSFPRTPEGIQRMHAWFQERRARLDAPDLPLRSVAESTGNYSRQLFDMMTEHGGFIQPAIINPHHTKHFRESLGGRTKTDHQDARMLALYGVERQPKPFTPPSAALQELREMSRYRDLLIRQRSAQKNLAEKGFSCKFVVKQHQKTLEDFDKKIAKIDAAIDRHINRHAELKNDAELLQSIPGVGKITARAVLSEAGDLRRFKRRNQVAAYAGLNPRQHQSGSSVMGRTRLSKNGNRRMRNALYMASLSAIRVPGPLKDTYDKHVAAGRAKKSALGIIMRKILVLMRSLLINNTQYDPDFTCG